jgi:hypothetical protein
VNLKRRVMRKAVFNLLMLQAKASKAFFSEAKNAGLWLAESDRLYVRDKVVKSVRRVDGFAKRFQRSVGLFAKRELQPI